MYQITKLHQFYLYLLRHLHNIKTTVFDFLFCLPTSLLAFILLLLLAYNGFTVFFFIHLPSMPADPSSLHKITSPVLYSVKEDTPYLVLKTTHKTLLQNLNFSSLPTNASSVFKPSRVKKRRNKFRNLHLGAKSKRFSFKVKSFFEKSSCKLKFFMTWISSVESFGDRELFVLETIFKSHPDGCLVMVSNSMDSTKGNIKFKAFLDKGFKLLAIRPDFDYLFKNTQAESWFKRLKKGNVNPGMVSLGQNLSNLVRLSLLYKFGGVYLDTDVIVLKSLSKLKNTIGAQTIDFKTRNWTRLNNAVLIFDKNHPLLLKFIQEFALTFDGNKWGHNGPYLVSRVVSRVSGRPGYNFTVLPPSAFYPVNWSRIRSFFQNPKSEKQSMLLRNKLELIHEQSFAVHLWNRQSKRLQVEERSIVHHLMLECCIFCNSTAQSL